MQLLYVCSHILWHIIMNLLCRRRKIKTIYTFLFINGINV